MTDIHNSLNIFSINKIKRCFSKRSLVSHLFLFIQDSCSMEQGYSFEYLFILVLHLLIWCARGIIDSCIEILSSKNKGQFFFAGFGSFCKGQIFTVGPESTLLRSTTLFTSRLLGLAWDWPYPNRGKKSNPDPVLDY